MKMAMMLMMMMIMIMMINTCILICNHISPFFPKTTLFHIAHVQFNHATRKSSGKIQDYDKHLLNTIRTCRTLLLNTKLNVKDVTKNNILQGRTLINILVGGGGQYLFYKHICDYFLQHMFLIKKNNNQF